METQTERGAKRLSEEERDRIVELKLNRVPVKQIAADLGCSTNTVQRHWFNYLDETAGERREHLDRCRQEAIARLDSVATRARRSAIRAAAGDVRVNADGTTTVVVAPDLALERGMLRTEIRALVDLSRIAGYEAPKVLQLAPAKVPSQEEALAVLAEFGIDVEETLTDADHDT